MRYLLVTSLSIFILFSCQKKKETPTKKKEKPVVTVKKDSIVVKKMEIKSSVEDNNEEEETISRKNTIEFLKKYGKENPESVVVFKTRHGNMKVKLYKNTPIHRASFIYLAKQGYFNTVCVHRIVEDFVVQGGNSENPKTRKMRKKFDSYTIPAEFRSNRKHKYGALAAARDWENNPNKRSTPFEFYFVQNKKGAFHLDGEHTVYGEIISGFDTLNKIAKEKVDNQEWPKNDVFFEVEVLR